MFLENLKDVSVQFYNTFYLLDQTGKSTSSIEILSEWRLMDNGGSSIEDIVALEAWQVDCPH